MPKYENAILNDRELTHGDYVVTAALAQELKLIMRRGTPGLSLVQRESLDMIAVKIARILSGNANEREHWIDIAGYATLVAELQFRHKEIAAEVTPPLP